MNVAYPRTSTLAIFSLIFGVLCWICVPFIGALVAVICGHSARSEIRRAPPGALEGDGMAVAGLILGWIHLALVIIAVFVLFAFLGGLAFLMHLAN